MKIKKTALIFAALLILSGLSACAEKPRISTSLGEFEITKVEFTTAYASSVPTAGTEFLVVRLSPAVYYADLIDKAQPYFCPGAPDASRARVMLNDASAVDILSVAYEQKRDDNVNYALIFEVPSDWRDKKGINLILPAQDNGAYEIK